MSGWKPSLGANCVGWATVFRVWAPDADKFDLQLQPQHSGVVTIPMVRSLDGYLHQTVPGARPGDVYSYTLDGRGPFPDPASRFQPQGVDGPSEIIDPSHFPWSDQAWGGTPRERLVLYELHVGTFTPEGSFASAAERLPYLKELGVTAVELMPLADFPGSRNWGYDGVAWFAPARCYGRPEALRRFVNQAHQLGLGVFLDVVYNHFGPDGAYHAQFSKGYYSPTHHSPCGARINFDGPGSERVRDFVIANALHWVHEYHLDGLRLDATHAIVDESPRPILAEVVASVRHSLGRGGRSVHVVAEDVRNIAHMLRPEHDGGWGLDAVWSDDFHHQVRRALAGDADGYFQDFDGSAASIAATARKGWFYCGQFAPYFNEPRGTDPVGLPLSRFVFFIQNHDQVGNRALGDRLHHAIHPAAYRAATALLLLLPETPLLFMGQEWAASTPFLYFTHHQPELGRIITQKRREEFNRFAGFADPRSRERIPDPQAPSTFEASRLRWHEVEREPHASTLRLYRDLLRLRRDYLAGVDLFEIAATGDAILTLRRGRVSALVCLRPGQAPLPAAAVRLVLSTEDPKYAADCAPPEVDLEIRSVRFQREKSARNPSELVRAWLGLRLEDCTRPSQQRRRTQVIVREVKLGTPAAQAGVQPGDILLFVQDQLVGSVTEVLEVLRGVPPGSLVPFELLRSGDYVILAVRVGVFPTHSASKAPSYRSYRLSVSGKPPQQRRQLLASFSFPRHRWKQLRINVHSTGP